MKLKLQLASLFLASAFTVSASASADFINSCSVNPDKTDVSNNACYKYISGFIGGALTTDVAIIEELKKNKATSSFIDRVFQTRAPNLARNSEATYFAKFCFPASKTQSELAKEVMLAIDKDKINDDTIDKEIYTTIKTKYPCN